MTVSRRSEVARHRLGHWPAVPGLALWIVLLAVLTLLAACERTEAVQRGYRGLNTAQLYKPADVAALAELNSIPAPEEPADADSPTVNEVFKNVQVLNDLSATEFSRLMQALSTWVSPEEGCDFCHNPDKLESDEKYTKVVARRMLQMTRQINTDWKGHVGGTGVTCWTCHRGQAVPSGDWFAVPAPKSAGALMGNGTGNNLPAVHAGGSALPYDPLSMFLTGDSSEVSVQGLSALKAGNRHSIKQAEATYALMMYMSQSLGVSCTYCHLSRSFGPWEVSTPQRVTAWHGIRMVRQLNTAYLTPIAPLLPANRLSTEGDFPKVGCATCHKGTYKPLNGVSPLTDYPVLAGVVPPAAPASGAPGAVPAEALVAPVPAVLLPAALLPATVVPAASSPLATAASAPQAVTVLPTPP